VPCAIARLTWAPSSPRSLIVARRGVWGAVLVCRDSVRELGGVSGGFMARNGVGDDQGGDEDSPCGALQFHDRQVPVPSVKPDRERGCIAIPRS
jgi:hypothetical protein